MELAPYYRMMEQMLHPTPMPEPALKTRALKAAAAGVGDAERFRLLDLAIYWGRNGSEPGVRNPDPYGWGGPPQYGCANCGECFIGCNTHSKNTLDLNYLWFAERAGAEVYSQHKVLSIEPQDGGYRIGFPRSPLGLRRDGAGPHGDRGRRVPGVHRTAAARQAWLPARRQDLAGHPAAHQRHARASISPATAISERWDSKPGRLMQPMDGPTITATVEYPDKLDGRGFIVEDGGFPDILRANLQRVPGGLSNGRRLLRFLKNLVGSRRAANWRRAIFNQLDFEAVRDALPYLCMGSDAADGDMKIDDEGRLQIDWHHARSMPLWREIESTLRKLTESPEGLGGNLMLNPTWSAQKQLVTVHPLGGCPMGDDESTAW